MTNPISRPVTLMDVKQALRDLNFRDTLPKQFEEAIKKYLQNPGCTCNVPFYKKIMTEAKEALQNYYPNKSIVSLEEDAKKLAENNFSVINCHIDELEEKLKRLSIGRKQIAVCRYEDQVTAIINDLDFIY
jgi:hypothetical protein